MNIRRAWRQVDVALRVAVRPVGLTFIGFLFLWTNASDIAGWHSPGWKTAVEDWQEAHQYVDDPDAWLASLAALYCVLVAMAAQREVNAARAAIASTPASREELALECGPWGVNGNPVSTSNDLLRVTAISSITAQTWDAEARVRFTLEFAVPGVEDVVVEEMSFFNGPSFKNGLLLGRNAHETISLICAMSVPPDRYGVYRSALNDGPSAVTVEDLISGKSKRVEIVDSREKQTFKMQLKD